MKLIRITSNDTSGFFETQFNQSILIKPNSKIALSSITSNLKPISFRSNGDYIYYSITIEGQSYPIIASGTIFIANTTYTKSNYQDLLNEITEKINDTMVYSTSRDQLVGGEWRFAVVNGLINISYIISPFEGLQKLNTDFSSKINIATIFNTTYDTQRKVLRLDDSTFVSTASYNNCVAVNTRLSLGMASFETQIYTMTRDTNTGSNLDAQGFLMMVSENEIHPSNMDETDIVYGFGVGHDGTDFTFYRQEGIIKTNLSTVPTYTSSGTPSNSKMEILVNGNKVDLRYTDQSGTWFTAHTYNHDNKRTLYPAVIFHSSKDYYDISVPIFTLDPYNNRDVFLGSSRQPISIEVKLGNENNLLANFLNFDKNILHSPFKIGGGEFRSDKVFIPSIVERNLILELVSHNIESYDSKEKQRRNILSNLITSNKDDIITNENTLIFIDMNNPEILDMRNILMRLTDEYYNPVETLGNSVATILFADASDKI